MILLSKNDVKTMTSEERVFGLHDALKNVHKNKIEGDIVECGVWMGGNLIIAKKFFDSVQETNRKFYAFDTFEGMTEPSENDPITAHRTWNNKAACVGPLEQGISEFKSHDVYDDRIIIVKGDVCLTLLEEKNIPEKISILRLDTDWYDSTKVELEILYTKLVPGGFLIIDDYGHWTGCKKAVDEFFGEDFINKNFKKLDYTGISYQKT